MLHKIIVVAAVLMLAAGCDKPNDKEKEIHLGMPNPNAAPSEAMNAPFVPPPDIVIPESAAVGGTPRQNTLFSLTHALTLSMAHDAVAARFAAARDACLNEVVPHCVLTSASITAAGSVSASLSVALPHEQVTTFQKRLIKPIRQDGGTAVEITQHSTTAENQTAAAADIDRELAQAKTYRDSLEQLAKRPSLSVDEVLKIHTALMEAQEAVDRAEAAKRASDSKIVLEHINITLEERPAAAPTSAFDGFWSNAGEVFLASTAAMLLRIVNALPWLPLALVLAWIAARFLHRLQLRRSR